MCSLDYGPSKRVVLVMLSITTSMAAGCDRCFLYDYSGVIRHSDGSPLRNTPVWVGLKPPAGAPAQPAAGDYPWADRTDATGRYHGHFLWGFCDAVRPPPARELSSVVV
jgi:hypothetical protein